MKIPELKVLIQNYSTEELHALVVGLYKAIPKRTKEDHCIDDIVRNPSALGRKPSMKRDAYRPIDEITAEVDEFVNDALEGLYYAPNRIIPKSERPKWRFIVKRLYKELSLAAKEKENAPLAAQSMEKLYRMLCRGCEIYLFNSYDVFESVGVTQRDFFVRVLELHHASLPHQKFLDTALALFAENSLNRYTLYSDLMVGIINFLSTPDLRYLAIEKADRMRRDLRERKKDTTNRREEYERKENENKLCEFVCRCYFELAEYENALEYFEKNFRKDTREVKLYILVRLLMGYKQAERIVRCITDAEARGIVPRESLLDLKQHILKHARLPGHGDI